MGVGWIDVAKMPARDLAAHIAGLKSRMAKTNSVAEWDSLAAAMTNAEMERASRNLTDRENTAEARDAIWTPQMALACPDGTLSPLGVAVYAATDWRRRSDAGDARVTAWYCAAVEAIGCMVIYECPGVLNALLDADRALDARPSLTELRNAHGHTPA